jgi:hypothetical protein
MQEFYPPIHLRENDELIIIAHSLQDDWQQAAIDQAQEELNKRGITLEEQKIRLDEIKQIEERAWADELKRRKVEDYAKLEKVSMVLFWIKYIFTDWGLRSEGYELKAKRRLQLLGLGISWTVILSIWAQLHHKIQEPKSIKEIEKPHLVSEEYFPQNFKDDSVSALLTMLNEPSIYKNQDSSLSIFRIIYFSKDSWLTSKLIRVEKYEDDTMISFYPMLPDSQGGYSGIGTNLHMNYWDTLQILLTNYNFENLPFRSVDCEKATYGGEFLIIEESKKGKYYLIKRTRPINPECIEYQNLLSIVSFFNRIAATQKKYFPLTN